MSDNTKMNNIALISGIIMIIFSVLNYLMNDDYVSMGIFVFVGLGFILSGIAPRFEESKAQRIKKYARTFFFGAAVILIYWLAAVKFQII
jgi:uncharacterized membrane protein HdeD (DUF308 family)